MTAVPASVLRAAALQVRNEHTDHANTAIRVGDVLVALIDSIGTVINAATMSIGLQSAALANTTALQGLITSAMASFSYGKIMLPPGVIWLAEGSVLGTVCLQFGATATNLWLCGSGEGVTILKLKDSGNSHVINVDGATNVKITSLTVDGNRANNTTTSYHAIRTGTAGVDGLVLEDVTVQNTRGYGFGMQGGNKKRVRMNRCTAVDTGLDGCDWKNTSDDNQDIVITAYSAKRWGLDLSVTEQAGLDLRGPCQVSGVWCSEGPADGHYIRVREGEIADASLGGQYSHLTNLVCIGNSGSTSIGIYCAAHDVQITGAYAKDMLLGAVVQGERVGITGMVAESCDDESFQVNVAAENVRLTDCHSLTATGSGFRIRGPRCKMVDCSSGGDAVTGIVTEATATGLQSTGFDCEGTGGVMGGIDITSADAVIVGGDISGCFRGLSTVGARTKFIGVCSHNNTDDGLLVGVGGDDCLVSGCSLINNTDDGATIRADRCRIYNNVITGNPGTGVDIIVGADDTRIDGNRFSGNGAALGDSGANTRVGYTNDGLSTPYLHTNIKRLTGTGSPEGVHVAPVGSQYARTDGGASTCLYIKESGVGNTGWVAK